MSLERMIEALSDAAACDPAAGSGSDLTPEARIEALAGIVDRYRQTFQEGDLVTPYPDTNLKGAGDPHVVVEVRAAEPDFTQNGDIGPGDSRFGGRWAVRVASVPTVRRGSPIIALHWIETWQLRPYHQPGDLS